MENKIIGCLIIIIFLGINIIIEGLSNLSKNKIIKEQEKLINEQRKIIKKQVTIIKGFDIAFKKLKETKEQNNGKRNSL